MKYVYDDVGRLTRVIDATGNARTYNYDAVGNILSIADDEGCPSVVPTVADITPTFCRSAAVCQMFLTGGSLMGGAVTSSDIQAAITHCRELDCGTITCRLSPGPFMPPGPVTISVTTPFGSAEATVQIEEASKLEVGELGRWRFAGNTGAVVTLAMTRIINRQDGTSTLDPLLELRDSRGYLLIDDDDSGPDLPFGPGRNAVIRDFTLPATDTYIVVARGSGGTYGTYNLEIEPSSISLIPEGQEPPEPAFVFEGTVSAVPAQSAPVDFQFQGTIGSAAQRETHTFAANGGTVTTVQVNRLPNQVDGSGTLDPAAELLDSRGFLLRQDDDSGGALPPGPGHNALILNYELPATDTYSVVVSGSDGTVGPYDVKVIHGPLAVETEPDESTFPANAGSVATIHVNRVANNPDGSGTLDPAVELRDSRGFLLGRDDDSGNNQPPGPGRNARLTRIRLNATDKYSVSVNGANATLGPYTAEVFLEE